MNPNLSNALSELAAKLGTTADRVYPMLVAKEKLDAALAIWGFGALAVLMLASVIFCIVLAVKEGGDNFLGLTGVISFVLFLMFSVFVVCSVGDYYYPEAAAIKSLLARK